MKLWIAVAKEPEKWPIDGKLVDCYGTSTARESKEALQELYESECYDFYCIEKDVT